MCEKSRIHHFKEQMEYIVKFPVLQLDKIKEKNLYLSSFSTYQYLLERRRVGFVCIIFDREIEFSFSLPDFVFA